MPETLLLSRIHFGVSIGFHYLFPAATLGLTFFILIFEILHVVKKDTRYRDTSAFFIKLLAVIFTMGVATGLVMPFAFGTNWSRFSLFASPVIGPALSLEATIAFALESSFLALLLFGRNMVSQRLFILAAAIIFFASHLSGFLIVAVNSWMHTPAGFALVNGAVTKTSLLSALFNPSTLVRYAHVITAAWLTGAFIVICSGAWFAARNRHPDFSRITLSMGLPVALALSLAQPLWGHFHILDVLHHTPEKEAAYEGLFKSTKGATLYAFGIPDEKNERIRFGIGIPGLLSFLESGNPFSYVEGLDKFPKENWPPVNAIFTTFHLMVLMGVIMIGVSVLGMFLLWRKKLFSSPRYLKLLPFMVPVPFLANELGWIGTEMGRQPWVIYGILRTADAHTTTLPAWQIALSLGISSVVYCGLLVILTLFIRSHFAKGPHSVFGGQ